MWIMGKVGRGKAKPWCIQKKGLRVEKQKYNYRQGKTDRLSCLPPIFSTQEKKNRHNTFNLAQRNLEHTSIVKWDSDAQKWKI